MIRYFINDKEITRLVKGNPEISQSKTYLDKGLKADIINITINNSTGELSPLSGNAFYNPNVLTNNTFKIYNDNTILFSGYLIEPIKKGALVLFKGVRKIYKYLDKQQITYSTIDRGAGAYPITEYNLMTDDAGFTGYFETPAYLVYHILQQLYDSADIDGSSFITASTAYGACYIQTIIDKNCTLRKLLNYISDKFFLYIYETDEGLITCQYAQDFKTNYIDIQNKHISNIDTIKPLRIYNDYYIQTTNNTYTKDFDNNNIGSAYRINSGQILPLEIKSHGFIFVANDTAAIIPGEYAINNFHYNREGIKMSISLSANDAVNLNKGLRVTSDDLGFTNKYFEIFSKKKNHPANQLIIEAYELL